MNHAATLDELLAEAYATIADDGYNADDAEYLQSEVWPAIRAHEDWLHRHAGWSLEHIKGNRRKIEERTRARLRMQAA